MPMAIAANRRWTVDQLNALPDDGTRHEIIDGELFVTPAPSLDHQAAALTLAELLQGYLRERGTGHAFVAPADIEFADDTVVEPDVFVLPLVGGKRPRRWTDVGRLLLAVEILSPSSARADRVVKRRLYQRQGVPEYWIVDMDSRLVERWRPEDDRPEVIADRLLWQPDPGAPPLEIDLLGYFSELLGD